MLFRSQDLVAAMGVVLTNGAEKQVVSKKPNDTASDDSEKEDDDL